ncbi:MarR family winged helix-turn-helix transcriptional regulator [Sphingopyxis sp. MSC1_008]|jgi:DNA-binding MarR family transcriptional regulator|uniref:MarR family winged helix-turn-helix transcriptional regulator n=1 Tax=Sphingopyxis sp. MSC1_008 TaxID=2909265 RepID=UPI0020BEA8CB|nr:MarR family transcriptional regulator [Sphingopyxis sp. MSC1_008]
MKQDHRTSESLVDALVPTAFATMAVLNKIGAENDLSLTLLRVLGILRDRRPRMAELADHLGLEKQTMSGLIARAEKRGLVMRVPSNDDRRAVDVLLTNEGNDLFDRLHDQMQDALAPLTRQLTISDQRLLKDLLWRLLEPWEGHPPANGG